MDDILTLLFGGGMALTLVGTIVTVACSCGSVATIVGGVFYLLRQSAKKSEAVAQAARSWPTTTGTILKSRVEVSGGEYTTTNPRVVYEYSVGGVRYESDQIVAGWGSAYSKYGGAYDVVDAYPVGAEVTVYYNPANPSEAALEHKSS